MATRTAKSILETIHDSSMSMLHVLSRLAARCNPQIKLVQVRVCVYDIHLVATMQQLTLMLLGPSSARLRLAASALA